MITCPAAANPRSGVLLRCDRQAGHDPEGWHYDFHQDVDWEYRLAPDALFTERFMAEQPAIRGLHVVYRTVGS